MPALNLPTCPASAVWALLRDRLRNDTTLQTACVDFEFAEDQDITRSPGDVSPDRVTVFVMGRLDRWQWYSEHEHEGALVLMLATVLRSHDFVDAANLTTAIHKALYDDTNTDTFRVELTDAGATTGQPIVSRPLTLAGRDKQNGGVNYTGEIAIQVRTPIFGA
jgi:hypothetical protein